MDSWSPVPQAFRALSYPLPGPWEELFGPLRHGRVDDLMVVAQIGQSLDGRVATETGHSHYINGPAGLAHLHRLRALVDAVVIGVGTALADDPQLTVRRVTGPQPARVVIDARGRLSAGAKMLAKDGERRLVVTGAGAKPPLPSDIEIVGLPKTDGQIAPADREIQNEILAGWAAAAREMGDVPLPEIVDWLTRRRDLVAAGRSSIRVGHVDFFATPTGTR